MPDGSFQTEQLKERDALPMLVRNVRATIVKRKKKAKAAGDSLEDQPRGQSELGPDEDLEDDEDDGDGDEELYDVSLSSEEPVDRWFGREILDHSPESVNLERAADGGLPLLANHDDRALPIGRIRNIRAQGGKLKGVARFSKTQAGRDAKTLVDEGHREMSIGYSIDQYDVTPGKADEPSTYRATRWTPMEGSLVSVPADFTIGVGRNAGGRKFPVTVRHLADPAPQPTEPQPGSTEIRTMPQPAAASADPKVAAEIVRRAALHGHPDKAADFLERGLTLDQVNAELLELRATAPTKQPAAEQLQLSEREQKQYSYGRAILAAANAAEGKRDACFELDISQELERTLPADYRRRGGLLIPTSLRGRAGAQASVGASVRGRLGLEQLRKLEDMTRTGVIDSQTANAIKEVVFTVYGGELIEILRNQAMVVAMGARVLTGLSSPIAFPRETGDVTANWVAENSGTDVTASNVTTDLVSLVPKTLQATTAYSRQLLVQSSVDVEAMVRQSIAAKHALAWDLAAIHGTGSGNNQPLGIYNQTGVLTVDFSNAAFSNTGQLIAYTGVTEMEDQVASSNALRGELGYLTTPGIATDAKRTLKFPGAAIAQGGPLWEGTLLEGEMNGYESRATNQVSKTLGTGGAPTGGTFHGLIFGNWEEVIIGQFGGAMEMIVDPYSKKKQGLIEVASFQMADVAIRHPVSFCVGINLNK